VPITPPGPISTLLLNKRPASVSSMPTTTCKLCCSALQTICRVVGPGIGSARGSISRRLLKA
jgi:hypothetical protein